jgi:hypothetical protein
VLLDGVVSFPLIYSLFETSSPGHDGAVLLRGGRVERFGLQLPLSRHVERVRPGGTRHSAALGLAEVSDALVVVVSEERGTISVAQDGALAAVAPAALAGRVREFLDRSAGPTPRPRSARWTRNLGTKLASLALATVLWFAFAYRLERVERTFEVPIEIRRLPQELVVLDVDPPSVAVTLSGPELVFDVLDPSTMVLAVEVEGGEGRQLVELEAGDLRRPQGLAVDDLRPATVEVVLGRAPLRPPEAFR